MTRPLSTLPLSPSQTIGPFSHEAWRWACNASASATGELTIDGILLDGDGAPVNDGMIETWSPAAADGEQGTALPGFRRVATDDRGGFTLQLARPPAGEPAALVTVFARGLVLHQFTAVFLDDDAGLDGSSILRQVPAARRATLIARKSNVGANASTSASTTTYSWQIRLQGADETVFFDYA